MGSGLRLQAGPRQSARAPLLLGSLPCSHPSSCSETDPGAQAFPLQPWGWGSVLGAQLCHRLAPPGTLPSSPNSSWVSFPNLVSVPGPAQPVCLRPAWLRPRRRPGQPLLTTASGLEKHAVPQGPSTCLLNCHVGACQVWSRWQFSTIAPRAAWLHLHPGVSRDEQAGQVSPQDGPGPGLRVQLGPPPPLCCHLCCVHIVTCQAPEVCPCPCPSQGTPLRTPSPETGPPTPPPAPPAIPGAWHLPGRVPLRPLLAGSAHVPDVLQSLRSVTCPQRQRGQRLGTQTRVPLPSSGKLLACGLGHPPRPAGTTRARIDATPSLHTLDATPLPAQTGRRCAVANFLFRP